MNLRTACSLCLLSFGWLFFSHASHSAETVRLAVMSPDEDPAADLVTARLPSSHITLVERDQISRILHEQSLSLAGMTIDQAIEAGRLLDAQGIVLFRQIPSQSGDKLTNVTLIAVSSGAILASMNTTAAPAALADLVGSEVERAIPKFNLKADQVIKLSVVNFRSLRGTREIELPLTKIISAYLSSYPDFVVLERSRLPLLVREKQLSSIDSPFWNGSYLVRGTVEGHIDSLSAITVCIEIVPPEGPSVTYTVEGDRRKLDDLSLRCSAAVAGYFRENKTPVGPGWDNQLEAERFIQEADLAYRNLQSETSMSAALAAWSLGSRTPRLSELLVLLTLEKLSGFRMRSTGNRSAHDEDTFGRPDERLRPFIKIAATFNRNAAYWRGNPKFWFSEDLDRIDNLLIYYQTFLKAAQSDPLIEKYNNQGKLGLRVLLAASWPQVLIHRDLERKLYRDRVSRMAVDLRTLCAELLASRISPEQRAEILELQAAMLPFWSTEGGLTKDAIRSVLADPPGGENFMDSVAKRFGLMQGYFLATQYACFSDLRVPFIDLRDSLIGSTHPGDRVLGQYIRYYTTPPDIKNLQPREQVLRDLYEDVYLAIANDRPGAEVLRLYLLGTNMLFDEDKWTYSNIQMRSEKDLTGSRDLNPLTEYLSLKVRMRLALYFVDRVNEENFEESKKQFLSYLHLPQVGSDYKNKRVPTESPQVVKDSFQPYITRYLDAAVRSPSEPQKLALLKKIYTDALIGWPELFGEYVAPVAPPRPSSVTAHLRWSIRQQCEKIAGHPVEWPQGKMMGFSLAREMLIVGSTGGDAYYLFRVSLSGLETTSQELPLRDYKKDGKIRAPSELVENENYTYLIGDYGLFLKQDRKTGEWKSFDNLSVDQGFEKDGLFYFCNGKEFLRLDPKDDKLEVLASIQRTPALSPLDDSSLQSLSATKGPGDRILVNGHEERGIRGRYSYDPANGKWELDQPIQPVKRPPRPPGGFLIYMRGQLVFSDNLAALKESKGIPVVFAGREKKMETEFGPMPLMPVEGGYLMIEGRTMIGQDVNVWFVDRSAVEAARESLSAPVTTVP